MTAPKIQRYIDLLSRDTRILPDSYAFEYEMDPADGQLSLDDDPEVPWDEDEDEEGGSCAF